MKRSEMVLDVIRPIHSPEELGEFEEERASTDWDENNHGTKETK